MKKILLRVLSVVLSLIMIFGIVPMNVFAEEKPSKFNAVDSEVTIEGTSGMDLILNNLEQTNVDENNSGCSIFDVDMKNKEAYVQYSTNVDCKLVVAIYDDETSQMLASGMTDITMEEKNAVVIIDIPKMPEYYLVKAFMLDNNLAPLSSSFSFFEQTSVYEDFMSVTPEDFDDERVIPLGEDINQSFGALATDVEIADFSAKMTVDYDSDNGVYIFENPTNDIKDLKVGETLFYQETSDEFVLLKAKNIETEGNVIKVTEDVDIALEDAFDYIRYDEGAYYDDVSADSIETGDCVEVIGDVQIIDSDGTETFNNGLFTQSDEDYGDEGSDVKGQLLSTTYSIDFPNQKTKDKEEQGWLKKGIKLTGSVGYTLGASARLHWDVKIGPDYFEYKVEVESKVEFDIKVTGSLSLNPDVLYWQLDGKDKKGDPKGFKIGKTGLIRLYIKVYPVGEITGEIEPIKVTFLSIKGAIINSSDGFNKLNDDSKWIDAPDFFDGKLVAKFGIGIEFKIGREAGKKDKKGDKKLIAAVVITVEVYLKAELTGEKYDANRHSCKLRLQGTLDFCIDGSVGAELKIFKVLKKIKNEKIKKYVTDNGKLQITAISLSYEVDLGKCHVCWYDSHLDMGLGVCPNKKTLVTVYVTSEDKNEPIKDVVISVSSKSYKTGEDGKVEIYLVPATYTIKATYNNKTKAEGVAVSEFDKEVYFKMDDKEEEPDPEVSGKTTSSYSEGTLTISGKGNMDDYTGFNKAPWASYKDSIEHIVIESGVTSIGDYAFAQCTNVETITIADTVKKIGMASLYQCDSLQKIVLPSSVEKVGDYAFYGCYSMTSLSLGAVKTIGKYAFAQCTGLKKVTVPSSTTSIDDSAFAWCQTMKTIEIKNKNCTIADSANTIYVDTVISAPSGSTAQAYAKKYGRTFSTLTTQSVVDTTEIYDSLAYTYSSCVAGNDYILLNVTGYGSNFELTTDNLEYIDQLTADKSGKVSGSFIPKKFVSDSVTLLIGDFGKGTEVKVLKPEYVSTSVEIDDNPGVLTINFKESVMLTATVISPIEDCYIQWYINDEPYCEGDTFEYYYLQEEIKVTAKLVDVNGNSVEKYGEEIFDEETIAVNAGFFQRFIAFFKFTIFRMVVIRTN